MVKYEESSKRMNVVISILQVKEQENFITDYVRDLKRAFAFNFNKVDAVAVLDEDEDINFANSRIQKADFFMYRIKDYLSKECKKDDCRIKELVEITIERERSEEDIFADRETKELIEKPQPEKAKKPRGYKGGQVQPFQKDK